MEKPFVHRHSHLEIQSDKIGHTLITCVVILGVNREHTILHNVLVSPMFLRRWMVCSCPRLVIG